MRKRREEEATREALARKRRENMERERINSGESAATEQWREHDEGTKVFRESTRARQGLGLVPTAMISEAEFQSTRRGIGEIAPDPRRATSRSPVRGQIGSIPSPPRAVPEARSGARSRSASPQRDRGQEAANWLVDHKDSDFRNVRNSPSPHQQQQQVEYQRAREYSRSPPPQPQPQPQFTYTNYIPNYNRAPATTPDPVRYATPPFASSTSLLPQHYQQTSGPSPVPVATGLQSMFQTTGLNQGPVLPQYQTSVSPGPPQELQSPWQVQAQPQPYFQAAPPTAGYMYVPPRSAPAPNQQLVQYQYAPPQGYYQGRDELPRPHTTSLGLRGEAPVGPYTYPGPRYASPEPDPRYAEYVNAMNAIRYNGNPPPEWEAARGMVSPTQQYVAYDPYFRGAGADDYYRRSYPPTGAGSPNYGAYERGFFQYPDDKEYRDAGYRRPYRSREEEEEDAYRSRRVSDNQVDTNSRFPLA